MSGENFESALQGLDLELDLISSSRPFWGNSQIRSETHTQGGEPTNIENIENSADDQGVLSQEAINEILKNSEESMPLSEDDFNTFLEIAYTYKVNPNAAKKYYEELKRHFENRVKTDPSREAARPCLEGPIRDAIEQNGFEKVVNELGAVIRLLEGQDTLYIRIGDIVVLLGEYKGEGQNVGTAYKLNADQSSQGINKANRPMSIQEANDKLMSHIRKCTTVPSYSPETSKGTENNTGPSEISLAPALALSGAVLAFIAIKSLQGKSRRQAY